MGVHITRAVTVEIQSTIDERKLHHAPDPNNNPYYCPVFAERLSALYIPLLPLWTSIMLSLQFSEKVRRLSNANVESWFNKKKTVIFQGVCSYKR